VTTGSTIVDAIVIGAVILMIAYAVLLKD